MGSIYPASPPFPAVPDVDELAAAAAVGGRIITPAVRVSPPHREVEKQAAPEESARDRHRREQREAEAKLIPRQLEPVLLEACVVCGGPLKNRTNDGQGLGYCSRVCRRRRHNRKR